MKAVLVLCLLASTPAFAQGVKMKKAWDSANESVAKEVRFVKEKCGVDIKATFDTKSYGDDMAKVDVASWCKDAVNAVAHICDSDADFKAAVAKQVKAVTCKYDAAVKKDEHYGNKLDLKGGTLWYSYNKDTANIYDETLTFLKNKL